MSPDKIRKTLFRLADAQSAVARQTGFASWPKLAKHVEQLRALEGSWEFESLEVDGNAVPKAAISSSRILIDGDRFRSESPEAIYEGVFNIDVDADPQSIDIEFVEGPEAGNFNYGIFECNGDTLRLCLDMTGKGRPKMFGTKANAGHAFEVLKRSCKTRPEGVKGGVRSKAASKDAPIESAKPEDFKFVPTKLLDRLQGEWTTEKIVLNGRELPAMMTKTGRRSAKQNEIKITVGGQTIIDAKVRFNEQTSPVQVDYLHVSGKFSGLVQLGVMEWKGESACFCMAPPGKPRPTDFACPPGSEHTLSQWRLSK